MDEQTKIVIFLVCTGIYLLVGYLLARNFINEDTWPMATQTGEVKMERFIVTCFWILYFPVRWMSK